MSETARRDDRCVIVGAGLAGQRTATLLRVRGFEGAITLLGREAEAPYDRPPLSKEYLRGEVDSTVIEGDMAGLNVDFCPSVEALSLRSDGVVTDAGAFPADVVVLATGASPVILPGTGEQLTLRTLADARRLRSRLTPGRRIAIIGAGWIGAELATAARTLACEVTVIEAAATPLATAIPGHIGEAMTPWWSELGIDLRLETSVASIEEDGVVLSDGSLVVADTVITAVGVRPETDWLCDSGLEFEGRAIRVDDGLQARPGVYAVGDVAAWRSGRYGRHLRLEHWDNALRGPEVAVANIVGEHASYDPVPYVWSEQFGRYLQFVGMADPSATLVYRGTPGGVEGWSVFWVRQEDSVLIAALTVDRQLDAVQARRLAKRGERVDMGRLRDRERPVKDTVMSS